MLAPASEAVSKPITSSLTLTGSIRCGERLSTVNGPATWTTFRSSQGLSYRYSNGALAAMDASDVSVGRSFGDYGGYRV